MPSMDRLRETSAARAAASLRHRCPTSSFRDWLLTHANPALYDSRFETGDPDITYATGNSFSKLKNWGIAATMELQLPANMELKSITAYRDLHWLTGMDLDGSPLPILHTSFQMPQRELSEELQLNGTAVDDRLRYTVGAYYFKESGHLHDYVTFPGGLLMIDGPNDLRTRAGAIYTNLNFPRDPAARHHSGRALYRGEETF